MISGRKTRIQFLHIQDLLVAVQKIIEYQVAGIFNVTPDDSIVMNELPDLIPGLKLYVPEIIARAGIKIAWFFHLYKAPSSYLDFVRYEFIDSNNKLKKKLDWEPSYSTADAIRSLIIKK